MTTTKIQLMRALKERLTGLYEEGLFPDLSPQDLSMLLNCLSLESIARSLASISQDVSEIADKYYRQE
jgi:hypothetical protein